MTIHHRVQQVTAATQSEIYPEDIALIRKFLNKQEQILFYRMPVYDQRHSLGVAYRLKEKIQAVEARKRHPLPLRQEAMVAALLHDVGKLETGFSLLARSLYVIAKKLFVNFGWKFLLSMGQKQGAFFLFRNFYVLEYHALIGAKLLKQINGKSEVIKMVIEHQNPVTLTDPLIINLLKEADQDI